MDSPKIKIQQTIGKKPQTPQKPLNQENRYRMSQLQSQTTSFINQNPNKSPVKYRYLTKQQEDQERRQWNIFWIQCFGMFVFIYSSTCFKFNTGLDLQFFVGFLMAVSICAKQTGANLNPAVSIAMIFKTNKRIVSYYSLLWLYIKAQILGAILSMVSAIYLNGVYRDLMDLNSFQLLKDLTTESALQIILSQAIGVFVFIIFILYVTGSYSFIEENSAKYLYIAIFLYIGRRFAAASGNQINLALTISHAFVGIYKCNLSGVKYLTFWVVGDLLGVLLATSFYKNIVQPTLDYLLKHRTAKEMGKVEIQFENQMRQIQNHSQLINQKQKRVQKPQIAKHVKSKQEISNSSSEGNKKYKDYYKNLQNF